MSYSTRFRNRHRNHREIPHRRNKELQLQVYNHSSDKNTFSNYRSLRRRYGIVNDNEDDNKSSHYELYHENNRAALIISRIIVISSITCFVLYIWYNRHAYYKYIEQYTCTLGSEPLSTLRCAIPYSLNLILLKSVTSLMEIINKAIVTNNVESIAATCAFGFAIYKSCTAFFFLVVKNYEQLVHSFVLYVMGL